MAMAREEFVESQLVDDLSKTSPATNSTDSRLQEMYYVTLSHRHPNK